MHDMQQQHRAIIAGKRRFTCLSPTLLRMEFAPDGVFEDRRSLVAYAPRQAQPFCSVESTGEDLSEHRCLYADFT